MFQVGRVSLCAAVAVLAASSVQAALVQATYTGTVAEGSSALNFFQVGTDLGGQGYALVFLYNTAIGFDKSASFQELYGGTDLVPPETDFVSPVLSAVLTIGQISYSFASGLFGQVTMVNVSGGNNYAYHYAGSITGGAHVGMQETRDDGSIQISLTAAQEIDGAQIASTEFPFQGEFLLDDDSYASLQVSHLSITATAVPLPASLPLMGIALAGLGGLRRMRRRVI
jgi:hypothetical protein